MSLLFKNCVQDLWWNVIFISTLKIFSCCLLVLVSSVTIEKSGIFKVIHTLFPEQLSAVNTMVFPGTETIYFSFLGSIEFLTFVTQYLPSVQENYNHFSNIVSPTSCVPWLFICVILCVLYLLFSLFSLCTEFNINLLTTWFANFFLTISLIALMGS